MSEELAARSPLWILNPDAELELESPRGYQTKRVTLNAMRENFSRFDFLTQGDESCLLCDLAPAPPGGRRALLWCPTPSAVRRAHLLGYTLPPRPSLETLTIANSKASLIGAALPSPKVRELHQDEASIPRIEMLLGAVGPLRLKRLFGFAGRRQRKIQGPLRADDRRFIEDSVRLGGLLVEGELEILHEYSIHGVAFPTSESAARRSALGHPCQLQTDRFGSVAALQRLAPGHRAFSKLQLLGEKAQQHLERLGYFGPFGLDLLETMEGIIASDVNARFTLGFSIGLGKARTRAIEALFEHERFETLASRTDALPQ